MVDNKNDQFKPFKDENDYKYWYNVIRETVKTLEKTQLNSEICLRRAYFKCLLPGKKNIAAKYYKKEFSNYESINTGIHAMKIGAKWPPNTNVKAKDFKWKPRW